MRSRKLALLIGIERYRHSHQSGHPGSAISNLRGSVEDVKRVRALLEINFELDRSDILMLTNDEATRQGILDAIESHLVEHAEPGDNALFYFSGHGSYRIYGADRARESTLVPHDARPPSGYVPDLGGSELASCFKRIAARGFTAVLDCCHSGQLISERGGGLVRGIPPDAVEGVGAPLLAPAHRGLTAALSSARFALLTAAAPDELAWERIFDGRYCGVFTHFLTQRLRSVRGSATYREVMDHVRGMVNSYFALQNPQLEGGQADQFVFGAQERVRPDNDLIFEDGQLHGLTTTSLPAPKVVVSITGMPDLERMLRSRPHLQIENTEDAAPVDIRVTQEHGAIACHITGVTRNPDGWVTVAPLQINAASDRASLLQLCEERVLHWAKWLILLRLDNAQPLQGVRLKLRPAPAACGLEHTQGEYYDNEQVQYVIENESGQDVFVSLLSLADDGSVSVVYPSHEGPSRALPCGGRHGGVLNIELPHGKAQELNFLKLFATLRPSNFHLFTMHRARGTRDPLEELFEEAALGSRTLNFRSAVREWSTEQHLVRVRRRPGA